MNHKCSFLINGCDKFSIVTEFGCKYVRFMNEVFQWPLSIDWSYYDSGAIEIEKMVVLNVEGGEIASLSPRGAWINVGKRQ